MDWRIELSVKPGDQNYFLKIYLGTAVAKPYHKDGLFALTLSLLMSYIYIYIYMELLVKPEILTLYIHGPTFGIAENSFFLYSAQCLNTESMQKVILWHSCV
jgi:hypothetical protein